MRWICTPRRVLLPAGWSAVCSAVRCIPLDHVRGEMDPLRMGVYLLLQQHSQCDARKRAVRYAERAPSAARCLPGWSCTSGAEEQLSSQPTNFLLVGYSGAFRPSTAQRSFSSFDARDAVRTRYQVTVSQSVTTRGTNYLLQSIAGSLSGIKKGLRGTAFRHQDADRRIRACAEQRLPPCPEPSRTCLQRSGISC